MSYVPASSQRVARARHRATGAVVACVAALIVAAAAGADDGRMLSASSEEHLWLLLGGDPVALLHQGRLSEDLVADRVSCPLSQWPEATAAWGDRVWLVVEAADAARRDVYFLDAVFNPVLEAYAFSPADRLSIAPPIEAEGALAGLAGTARGPVALLRPPDADPMLLLLTEGRWSAVEGPASLPADGPLRIIPPGRGAGSLTILAAPRGERRTTTVHRRRADGTWTSRTIELDLQAVTAGVRVGELPLLVQLVARDTQTECQLSYLLPSALIPLTRFSPPSGPWLVAGPGHGLRLFELPAVGPATAVRAEALTVRRIDAIDGSVSERLRLSPPPGPGATVVHQSLLLALFITVTLLVLVARPGQQAAVTIPPELAPPSAALRAAALAIDLAPGVIAAMVLLDARPSDLIHTPLLASRLSDTGPYLLTIAVTSAHTSVAECASRRTLGKLLLGARVLRTTGERPMLLQLAWRNLVKLVVLLIPPLALLTLLSPHLQGVHDLFARTVVLMPLRDHPDHREEAR